MSVVRVTHHTEVVLVVNPPTVETNVEVESSWITWFNFRFSSMSFEAVLFSSVARTSNKSKPGTDLVAVKVSSQLHFPSSHLRTSLSFSCSIDTQSESTVSCPSLYRSPYSIILLIEVFITCCTTLVVGRKTLYPAWPSKYPTKKPILQFSSNFCLEGTFAWWTYAIDPNFFDPVKVGLLVHKFVIRRIIDCSTGTHVPYEICHLQRILPKWLGQFCCSHHRLHHVD